MDPQPEQVLRLRDVGVVRGAATLLSGIDWTVTANQRWVVLGPNGAGKTTLLQVASALQFPSSGEVTVLGERMGSVNLADLRPRIGLASAALAERLPGREKVLDVVRTAAYGMVGRWREQYDEMDTDRAQELLAQLGCAALAGRRYGTLSEGERKRVQIARALMTDPELLLLDEPAAGLDLGGREDLVQRLSALAADPDAPAMVLVTHHVEEIPPAMTSALLLRQGRVVASGSLGAVISAPALSECFGLSLEVERRDGRFTARAVRAPSGPAS